MGLVAKQKGSASAKVVEELHLSKSRRSRAYNSGKYFNTIKKAVKMGDFRKNKSVERLTCNPSPEK